MFFVNHPFYCAGSSSSDRPDVEASDRVLGETGTSTTDRCGDIFMVFEYVDYDLAGLLDSGYSFSLLQVGPEEIFPVRSCFHHPPFPKRRSKA